MPTSEPITVRPRSIDGLSVKADVYRPPGRGPHPVVLYLHSGALIWGSRRSITPAQVERYTAAGYAVVSADYRLAPETKLAAIVDDVAAALAWLEGSEAAGLGLDAARTAVAGSSAGGYLALLTGTMPARPRAIVSLYGYGNIGGEWYAKPSQHYLTTMPHVSRSDALATVGTAPLTTGDRSRFRFYLYCRQQGTWVQEVCGLGPGPVADAAIDQYCPARVADRAFPPTLLIHGDADTDVPVQQSQHMSSTLAGLGVPHRLRVVPGAGHVFDRDMALAASQRAYDEIIAFLDQHLR